MGFFRSSKIPQPPLPHMTIHLDAPSEKVFRPNEIVTGNVHFTPVVPIAPRAIEVSLFGHSIVYYRTDRKRGESSRDYHHWRDNAPLFEFTTNVLPNLGSKPTSLEVGKLYEFPFEFRFPTATQYSRLGQYENDDDDRWTVRPHNLPPTFLAAKHSNVEMDYSKIEYGVRVRLGCPGIGIVKGINMRDLVVEEPVLFMPFNSYPYGLDEPLSSVPFTKQFRMQTSALTGQSSTSIGFRQSIRDQFSSSTPKIRFQTTIEIPDILISGSEFQFKVDFEVLSKSENVLEVPEITFTVLNLGLRDLTFARAPKDDKASTFMDGKHSDDGSTMPAPDAPFSGQERVAKEKEKVLLNALPASATVELDEVPSGEKKATEQANSCSAWFTARVPGFTPPSFKSFAISSSHQIKLRLRIDVGGKHFKHEVQADIREMHSAAM